MLRQAWGDGLGMCLVLLEQERKEGKGYDGRTGCGSSDFILLELRFVQMQKEDACEWAGWEREV